MSSTRGLLHTNSFSIPGDKTYGKRDTKRIVQDCSHALSCESGANIISSKNSLARFHSINMLPLWCQFLLQQLVETFVKREKDFFSRSYRRFSQCYKRYLLIVGLLKVEILLKPEQ